MSCEIFTKTLLQDANLNNASIDTSFVQNLIQSYSDSISGIWLPLVITPGKSEVYNCELLAAANTEHVNKFNPCNCNNNQIFGVYYDVLESSIPDPTLECEYCNTCNNPCGNGGCDVRFLADDYIPKIPYLNQGYISGFNDFKHLKQFPSCSNPGLGKEGFISMNSNSLVDDAGNSINIYIDWKLQETISEIPYDAYSSRHLNEYIHNKSYIKSKQKSETCGCFILRNTAEMPSGIIKPYGFTNQTYDNIYMGDKKIGSHWKWNYQSGILGWYRHFDKDRSNDQRPIAGIDLYIGPGDIFYVTNQGPEISWTPTDDEDQDSQTGPGLRCPSGLKLVDGTEFYDIIPNQTEFFYISENIYDKFLDFRERLSKIFDGNELTEKSLLLSTHPEYDNIITDLLDTSVNENRNDLGQLSTLNQYMTSDTIFKSAFNINYCDTKEILIKTLAHKYGCYALINNSSIGLTESINDPFYVDLDFDMVVPQNKLIFNQANGQMLPNSVNYTRNFKYEQKFMVGPTEIVTSQHNAYIGFNESCSDSNYTAKDHVNYSRLRFYGSEVANRIDNSGSYFFEDKYENYTHTRKYPATAFNPHIDLVALHNQGGIYANSLPFDIQQKSFFISGKTRPTGPLKINFQTNDCSIKIYDIKIKKLQSSNSNTKTCERFPYSKDDSCKCFGFDYQDFERQFVSNSSAKTVSSTDKYTPSLSTNNSPTLQKYGGYNQLYLDSLFGSNVVVAGGSISNLNTLVDPLKPYGCEKRSPITLPNYINSYWNIKLNNMSTNHADIYVSVSENVDLTGRRFLGDPSDDDYGERDNMAWKRFTTKTTINNQYTLYNQQQNIILSKGSTIPSQGINIKLQNPFLSALISDNAGVYVSDYTADAEDIGGNRNETNLCALAAQIYSRRGDESSNVTLNFESIPRKQLLNFYIPSPTPYGTLNRGIFDPNKGLKQGSDNNNPIKNNRLYYEHSLFGSNFDTNKGILYGTISENIKTLANAVSNFEKHRKLRAYIKIGQYWYTINTSNKGSYTKNNKTYIGKPKYFEYVSNKANSISLPMFFPLAPKQLFSWSFFLNHAKFNNNSVTNNVESTYPFINGRDVKAGIDDKTLIFEGSRYYFMVDEVLNIVIPQGVTQDPNGDSVTFNVSDFKNVSQVSNSIPNASIVDFGGNKYFFLGGSPSDASNYLFLGDRYEEIVKLNNELSIEYDKNTLHGYIYNSKKNCDHPVKIFENNNGNVVLLTNNKIIKKELYVEGYDENNIATFRNPSRYKIFTKFTLQNTIRRDKLFAADISNIDINTSLCIFYNNNSTDLSSYLKTQYLNTKWSDVIDFDNETISELISDSYLDIQANYPSTVYNNWFYKQIINNFETSSTFYISIDGNTRLFSAVNPLYCILQKYNLNKNPQLINLANYKDYHNFIPIMDITMPNKNISDIVDLSNTTIGKPISGTIISPNWVNEVDSYSSPYVFPSSEPNLKFWINIENEDNLSIAYVPAGIYSETLRLDDPFFWLDSTISSTNSSSAGVRATFAPSVNTLSSTNKTLPGFYHNTITRDSPFIIYDIYGDGDDISECGEQDSTTCFLSDRGDVELTAKLKLANGYSSSSSVPVSCPYFFTYDAGNYNPFGQKNLIKIYRSELDPDNSVDTNFNLCSTDYLRPNYKRTFIDSELQSVISNGISVTHSNIVNNTDAYANEILFRILYGEDDKVNKTILNSNKNPLTAEDLVNYTEPKVEAKDVYNEILYNYDTNASYNRFKINGSFSIQGPSNIGDQYKFVINNINIEFKIVRIDGVIYAEFSQPYATSVVLYTEYYYTKNITIASREANLSDTETTTYELLGRSNSISTVHYRPWGRRFYTGNCAGYYTHSWGQTFDRHGLYRETCKPLPLNVTYQRIPVVNCASIACYATPNVSFSTTPTSPPPELCANDPCKNYDFGYCRRKQNCLPLVTDCSDNTEEGSNFLYSFSQCRTNFNLYGHYYRTNYVAPPGTTTPNNNNSSRYSTYIPSYYSFGVNGTAMSDIGPNMPLGILRGDLATRNILNDTATNFYTLRSRMYTNFCKVQSPEDINEEINVNNLGPNSYFDQPNALTIPCEGSLDNPVTGDPGDDLCGYISTSDTVNGRSFWIKSTINSNQAYNSICNNNICSISYTNNKIVVNVGSENICITNNVNINSCPTLSADLPDHAYISSENVQSQCNDCYDNSYIEVDAQRQTFQTIKTTITENLATIEATDINNTALIRSYQSDGPHWEDVGNSLDAARLSRHAIAPCGESAKPWKVWSGYGYKDSMGLASASIAEFKRLLTKIFQDKDSESNVTGFDYIVSWDENNIRKINTYSGNSVLRHRRLCSANNHVSIDDIVKGIIPGSCSELKFSTTETEYIKYRTTLDGSTIQQATEKHYTVTAYITYDYIRPITIQDKLKGINTCLPEGSTEDEFPRWYAEQLGLNVYTSSPFFGIYYNNYQNLFPGTDNYLLVNKDISKVGTCSDSIQCDYNTQYPNYPFAGAPCAFEDFHCWGAARDWRKVWETNESTVWS